jgi:hypothetical protein
MDTMTTVAAALAMFIPVAITIAIVLIARKADKESRPPGWIER